jgi:hypothetical protein
VGIQAAITELGAQTVALARHDWVVVIRTAHVVADSLLNRWWNMVRAAIAELFTPIVALALVVRLVERRLSFAP